MHVSSTDSFCCICSAEHLADSRRAEGSAQPLVQFSTARALMLTCCCRRDRADRESGAALRLAAAAPECQGGDLGHLPRELAPDAAHVPALRAGHPHASGRDPGQQGMIVCALPASQLRDIQPNMSHLMNGLVYRSHSHGQATNSCLSICCLC